MFVISSEIFDQIFVRNVGLEIFVSILIYVIFILRII